MSNGQHNMYKYPHFKRIKGKIEIWISDNVVCRKFAVSAAVVC